MLICLNHKGRRFRRKRLEAQQVLTKEDIAYLERNTRYNQDEIKEWFRFVNIVIRNLRCRVFRGFMDVCSNGNLDKEGMMDMYAMPRREAKVFIDQMFLMFDKDGNGTISFKVGLGNSIVC